MHKRFVSVLLPKKNLFPLEYKFSSTLNINHGDLVLVPFRTKQVLGIVWRLDIHPKCDNQKIRSIIDKAPLEHRIGPATLQLIDKTARYYMTDLGSIAKMVLPVDLCEKPYSIIYQTIPDHFNALKKLSLEQKNSLEYLRKQTSPSVLHGITGSGKTEVYFHLIAEKLSQNHQVLVLMPEIALGQHIINRFIKAFNLEPAVWNSSISKAKKKQILRGILANQIKIIIGTRSSIFLPYPKLGLIVVDEEHDQSYKQEEAVTYHARDVAVLRGFIEKIPVILSSATPSISTLYNVKINKYNLIKLENRFGLANLPDIHLIDMKKEKLEKGKWISSTLKIAIQKTLDLGQQILLFMNRRGYAPLVLCKNCAFIFNCPSCSSSLVFHKHEQKLRCHHCSYNIFIPKNCPTCDLDSLVTYGPGVERVHEEIVSIFPNSNIISVTKDTTSSIKKIEEVLEQIITKKVDIVVGTQILSKGYHFPHLSLVGVLDADLGINGGDLKAVEKTYQLLSQISGRAGREEQKGQVYIQTYYPDNLLLQHLIQYKEADFLDYELNLRSEYHMPPVTRMVAINFSGPSEKTTLDTAKKLVDNIPYHEKIRILGPAPAIMYKLKKKYRFRVLCIFPQNISVQNYIKTWYNAFTFPKNVSVKLDIDPYN